MQWFTADLHLGHYNIMKYCDRPFKTTNEMDKTIMDNLLVLLSGGDILYVLGDLTFDASKAEMFFDEVDKCHTQVHFIWGNHDKGKVRKIIKERSALCGHMEDIKVDGQSITLSHYAMRVWNKSHYNAWNLFGHSHGTLEPVGKQWDVGVDNTAFIPINFTILKDVVMEARPDNVNFIRK